jgi:hypothetical protein
VILVQGSLIINGTTANPVILRGDRLDKDYEDIPAQWIGIRLLPGSKDNIITGAIIRDGYLAIEVDSASANTNPNLTISHSIIQNMTAAGIVGYSAKILAFNNLISDCGQFTFYGALGGDYTLVYNTLADYNTTFNRQNPSFLLDNSPYRNEQGGIVMKTPLNFTLVNNIIYGSLEEELLLNNSADGEQSFTTRVMQNCLLRTQQNAFNINQNILNQDPQFENYAQKKYTLNASSPAKGKAVTINTITDDLPGKTRSNSAPTIGAYE